MINCLVLSTFQKERRLKIDETDQDESSTSDVVTDGFPSLDM